MSKKKWARKTRDNVAPRAVQIGMPCELIPVYDELQQTQDAMFANEDVRNVLMSADSSGVAIYRSQVEDVVAPYTKGWTTVTSVAWYRRLLIESIRRAVASIKTRQAIWDVLDLCGGDVTQAIDLMRKSGRKVSYYDVDNMSRCNHRPELPEVFPFTMDYSQSDRSMCYSNHSGHIAIKTDQWHEFTIDLPTSAQIPANSDASKPRFYGRGGVYMGSITYFIPLEPSQESNILGVDLGEVKPFAAIALNDDGSYSDELGCSRLSLRLVDKVARQWESIELLDQKIARVTLYGNTAQIESLLQERRQVRSAISRKKSALAKQLGADVVAHAIEHKCGVIKLEDLRFVTTLSGGSNSWNFSEVQHAIELAAEVNGIKVVRVNASKTSQLHPTSGATGSAVGRNLVFPNGEVIDRDLCASLNIAKRGNVTHPPKVVKTRTKHRPTPKRPKNISSRRRRYIIRTTGADITVLTSVLPIATHRFGGSIEVHGSTQEQQSLLIPKGVSISYRKVRVTPMVDQV